MPDASLIELAPGVFAYVQEPSGHGCTNAGVVLDEDGLTVIDTLLAPAHAAGLHAALEPLGLPVRRAVYTSSHVEFVGGSSVFWMAARYGRSQTSAMLDQPPNLAALQRLHPRFAADLAALEEAPTRPVSHTVDTAAWLSARACALPSGGQQLENLVVLVPEAEVLFAGAMCCFGVTPNAFDGDPEAWADALGDLGELAPTIVPGIGPVGSPADVLALQAYLYAVVDAASGGDAIPAGPWDAWPDRHLDEVNIERAALLAQGDHRPPPSLLRMLGLS